MMKFFTKRGSAEIVSIILIIVVLGALTLAITRGFSTNSEESFENGMNQQNIKFDEAYDKAIEEPNLTAPTFDGGDGGSD